MVRRRRAAVALAVMAWVLAGLSGTALALEESFPFEVRQVAVGEEASTVVVSAQYSCGPLDFGDAGVRGVVDLTVTQQTAGGLVTAYGQVQPEVCNGTVQAAEAAVTSVDGRPFTPGGTVTVLASGYVEGIEGRQTTATRAELPLVPVPASFSFTVAEATVYPRGTAVTLSGTYACGPMPLGPDGPGRVDLTLQQDTRGGVALGTAAVAIEVCDGTAQRWSATLPVDGERLRRGSASVTGSGFVCGLPLPGVLACQEVDIQQTVTLRR